MDNRMVEIRKLAKGARKKLLGTCRIFGSFLNTCFLLNLGSLYLGARTSKYLPREEQESDYYYTHRKSVLLNGPVSLGGFMYGRLITSLVNHIDRSHLDYNEKFEAWMKEDRSPRI